MTRTSQAKPGQSFTPLTPRAQPSAWTTELEWGGGLVLAAIVLALGYTTVRPIPRTRRREPDLPAPAYARTRRRL